MYYLAGQEAMLQKFVGNLNDKEKKAYDLLSQNKILRDSEQEPVIRVVLREIKDFAIQLNVSYNENNEIFWKWYLIGNEEAELLIKSKLNILEKKAEQPPVKKPEESSIEKAIEKRQEQPIQKELAAIEKPAIKKERKQGQKAAEDAFLKEINKFFEKNRIIVVSSEVIKKNSEMDFIVQVPSVVGSLQYYCKAKNKKKVSDSDLSNAYVKGQFRKLPVLVLSNGELSAKAKEMAEKELNNLTFKRI